MIRLYCEDIAKRVEIQNFYRDLGFSVDAPPCGEFISAANGAETTSAIVVGQYPPWLTACLRRGLPTYFVGNFENSFDAFDSPELIDILREREGDIRFFAYGGCLDSSEDGVFYLGYPLRLTPSEVAILSFLVRQSPTGVDQEQLVSVCVGDSHRKSSVLRQHISSINKKAKNIYSGRELITSDRKRGGVKLYYMVKNI